jgi:hypothetical protein
MNKEIQEDIQPIVDLFTGSDGGAGFAKFRHKFCPDVYAQNTPEAREFKLMMKRMAKLAKLMMTKA